MIRNEFDRIHAGYKFRPEPMIPVPGHPDVVVRYEDMVVFEAKGVLEVPHVAGGEVLMLPVKAMLDGVDIEGSSAPPVQGNRSTDLRRRSSATRTRTTGSGGAGNAPQAPPTHRGAAALDRSADHRGQRSGRGRSTRTSSAPT